MSTIWNALMTLQHNGANVAFHLPCRVDPVNINIILGSGGLIPTDSYDIRILNRVQPLPARSDYLTDETTGTVYQVFGSVFAYVNRVQMRATKYLGVTP